jgi:hypothetical protein
MKLVYLALKMNQRKMFKTILCIGVLATINLLFSCAKEPDIEKPKILISIPVKSTIVIMGSDSLHLKISATDNSTLSQIYIRLVKMDDIDPYREEEEIYYRTFSPQSTSFVFQDSFIPKRTGALKLSVKALDNQNLSSDSIYFGAIF